MRPVFHSRQPLYWAIRLVAVFCSALLVWALLFANAVNLVIPQGLVVMSSLEVICVAFIGACLFLMSWTVVKTRWGVIRIGDRLAMTPPILGRRGRPYIPILAEQPWRPSLESLRREKNNQRAEAERRSRACHDELRAIGDDMGRLRAVLEPIYGPAFEIEVCSRLAVPRLMRSMGFTRLDRPARGTRFAWFGSRFIGLFLFRPWKSDSPHHVARARVIWTATLADLRQQR